MFQPLAVNPFLLLRLNLSLMPAAYTDRLRVVLPLQELQAGVAILEIGEFSCILSVYHAGGLVCQALLPLGEQTITEDISMGLLIAPLQAARLKEQYGCAWAALAPEGLSIALPGLSLGQTERHVSLRNLADIIEARLLEILHWANRQISSSGLPKEQLLAGIVLTGPGARIPYLTSLAASILCLHARLGTPQAPYQSARARRAYSLHAAIGAQLPRPVASTKIIHPTQSPHTTNTYARKIIGFALGDGATKAVRYIQEAGVAGVSWLRGEAGTMSTDTSMDFLQEDVAIKDFDRWLDKGPSVVLILVCLGGVAGTAAAVRLALRCRERGIPTFGIVTMPYACEPSDRQERAQAAIARLYEYVGTLQVFHYEVLRCQHGPMTFEAAYQHPYPQMAALVHCLAALCAGSPFWQHDLSAIIADIRQGGVSFIGVSLADGSDRIGQAFSASVQGALPRLADLTEAGWIFVIIRTGVGAHAARVEEVDFIRKSFHHLAGREGHIRVVCLSDASLGKQIQLCWIAAGFRGLSRHLLEAQMAPLSMATEDRGSLLRLSIREEKHLGSCMPRGFYLSPSHVSLPVEGSDICLLRPTSPRTSSLMAINTGHPQDEPSSCQSPLDCLPLHQEGRKEFDPNSDRPMVIRENAAADEGTTISARPGSDSIEDPAMQDEVEERKRSEATTDDRMRSLSLRLDNAFDPTPKPERISPFIRRGSPERNPFDHEALGHFSPVSIRVDPYTQKPILSTLNTFLYGWKPD